MFPSWSSLNVNCKLSFILCVSGLRTFMPGTHSHWEGKNLPVMITVLWDWIQRFQVLSPLKDPHRSRYRGRSKIHSVWLLFCSFSSTDGTCMANKHQHMCLTSHSSQPSLLWGFSSLMGFLQKNKATGITASWPRGLIQTLRDGRVTCKLCNILLNCTVHTKKKTFNSQ